MNREPITLRFANLRSYPLSCSAASWDVRVKRLPNDRTARYVPMLCASRLSTSPTQSMIRYTSLVQLGYHGGQIFCPSMVVFSLKTQTMHRPVQKLNRESTTLQLPNNALIH